MQVSVQGGATLCFFDSAGAGCLNVTEAITRCPPAVFVSKVMTVSTRGTAGRRGLGLSLTAATTTVAAVFADGLFAGLAMLAEAAAAAGFGLVAFALRSTQQPVSNELATVSATFLSPTGAEPFHFNLPVPTYGR